LKFRRLQKLISNYQKTNMQLFRSFELIKARAYVFMEHQRLIF
jgi:hypothetical protein